MILRTALSDDLPTVLDLSQKALPHVNSIGLDDMRWFLEHAADADLAIHEVMLPPDMWLDKYSMSHEAAIMSGTQGHTTPRAFGKIMEITNPRMAVASHIQNDFDTAAVVEQEIRKYYEGPLNLAMDFMVWNISKDKLTTRMAVANPESFPPPAQVPVYPLVRTKP